MAGLSSLWSLEGVWSLSREIFHSNGDLNRFDGTATFRRSGTRLVEDEEGQLSGGSSTVLKATRRYIWMRDGDRLEVLFADMRPFHTVPLGVEFPETTYLCPPDRYGVKYDFSRWPAWTAEWHVEGPKKSYRMVSRYSPVA